MTLKSESGYLKYQFGQISINSETFNFGINLGLTGGKYLVKNIFNFKIEISIFEISNVLNFNIFCAFLIWDLSGLTGGKYFIKIMSDIKIEIVGTLEILDVPNFNKS